MTNDAEGGRQHAAKNFLVMPGLAAFAKASASQANSWPRRSLGGDGSRASTFFVPFKGKTWMTGTSSAKTRFALLPGHDGVLLFRRLCSSRLAVAHQAIEMHADVGGFGRGVGQRNGAIEGDPRLVVAAKLHQESAAHAEVMKIVRQPRCQRLDHVERRLRSAHF